MTTNGTRGRRDADEQLALAIASGLPIKDAAASAGVSHRTAHRRLNDAPFAARVAELRREMVSQAVARLASYASSAVEVLHGIAEEGESDSVRVQAAKALLSLMPSLRDHAELEDRIRALEEVAR